MVLLGLLNVEGTEFMMILLVALLVFGPERLPEVARKAAKAITSVRRMSDAFQNELRSAVDLPIDPLIKAQSGGSLSDVMNRLTAEAEAEEAAKAVEAKEGESTPSGDDDVPAVDADEPATSDTEITNDPFAGSVRDPFADEDSVSDDHDLPTNPNVDADLSDATTPDVNAVVDDD